MPHLNPRNLILITLTLAQAGCGAGWHRLTPADDPLLPPRQQVQIWQDGRALRLHGVVIGPDSVSGIPFLEPVGCDSCRVTLAAGQVDSIRAGDPTGGFWRSVGLVVSGGVVLTFLGCVWYGCELAET